MKFHPFFIKKKGFYAQKKFVKICFFKQVGREILINFNIILVLKN